MIVFWFVPTIVLVAAAIMILVPPRPREFSELERWTRATEAMRKHQKENRDYRPGQFPLKRFRVSGRSGGDADRARGLQELQLGAPSASQEQE